MIDTVPVAAYFPSGLTASVVNKIGLIQGYGLKSLPIGDVPDVKLFRVMLRISIGSKAYNAFAIRQKRGLPGFTYPEALHLSDTRFGKVP